MRTAEILLNLVIVDCIAEEYHEPSAWLAVQSAQRSSPVSPHLLSIVCSLATFPYASDISFVLSVSDSSLLRF
ncbi:hypothetical protein OESDEN_10034 [Oesophagostomum dentatum]|uniref:Uncharacterized protein n=1 Tax=Oesophagostomum dentatum TaxID=61180 RepID=A0A0B1SYU6_OESDE|nr:hypothetical protein OESDEN_10034 [Oesophagostomum dentatum]